MLSEDYAASFQEYFDAYYEEILKYCYIHLAIIKRMPRNAVKRFFFSVCKSSQPSPRRTV